MDKNILNIIQSNYEDADKAIAIESYYNQLFKEQLNKKRELIIKKTNKYHNDSNIRIIINHILK